ncbi:hypothetical protein WICANDRAFT_84420 [Wickerhamomyces anomalus NRRL Y-366-8]|uniref:DUF676 domain-containing protein n=1 Tax=Wickerhamomyces anomalus (strain ATCC 58044 / CBS 1984 / NCYC 433 / NRRL Y-366-8) TaxID=683960 RepID=A0A1E3P160_WICAA|nr:uncharacterized protein WICANDRAFT_84420 [Wickerhamomyces anomalus NRRL Y-366-8]ODQ58652.1 hypothetical protein WICANDRAFT_84420 [Wickerhamomyces anomalus NRRL Y-366-8]
MSESDILYRSKRSVKVGQLERYVITYEPEEQEISKLSLKSLWLKVRNIESLPMRAAFLMGPYILYVDVRTEDYHHSKSTFVTADQPKYEPNLSPGQSFNAELSLHNIKKKYVWIVDVVSQILFNASTDVGFELLIGRNLDSLSLKCEKLGSFNSQLTVNRKDTLDLWNLPRPMPNKDIHLVVLTHGLHSNVEADMYYIKEQLDKNAEVTGENLLVKGFPGNTCKTEKGVKYLGSRVAEYIVNELYTEDVKKISFVGHSLGGLVQTFAIAYIEMNFPWFFEKVTPVNFITLAAPLLGIVTDNPAYIKAALSVGIVGKTGQDLGLQVTQGKEPLLKLLPTGPTHKILKKFHNRTVYANSVNDGIVPLYTSALLYLDWKGLTKVANAQRTFINPFQKAMSLLAPNAQAMKSFPKTSMIESAASLLLPPLPPLKYIIDPGSRPNVIIHDRVYTEADIPPKIKRKKTFMQTLDPNTKFEELEEDIAREWHNGMSWRKVLVHLQPDSHNNIVVRRRFANAYGWNVIDHLVENHFTETELDLVNNSEGDELKSLLDRNDIQKDNKEIDLSDMKMSKDTLSPDHEWVNSKNEESFFDAGATGFITNFNEMFENFKNWNMGIGALGVDSTVSDEQNLVDRTTKEDFDPVMENYY